MRAIEHRLNKLENVHNIKDMPPLEVILIDCKEQVTHPDRFNQVLESEKTGESGMIVRTYSMDRK